MSPLKRMEHLPLISFKTLLMFFRAFWLLAYIYCMSIYARALEISEFTGSFRLCLVSAEKMSSQNVKGNRVWFHVMWPPCSGVLESSSQTGQLWNISSKIFWWRVLQCPAQGKCLIAVRSYLGHNLFLSCSCLIWILSLLLFQAQRNNEDVNAIEPLFSVNIDHRVSPLNAQSVKFKTQYN